MLKEVVKYTRDSGGKAAANAVMSREGRWRNWGRAPTRQVRGSAARDLRFASSFACLAPVDVVECRRRKVEHVSGASRGC